MEEAISEYVTHGEHSGSRGGQINVHCLEYSIASLVYQEGHNLLIFTMQRVVRLAWHLVANS